jgi:methanogenic corrinoid protein MtbC1
MFALAIIAESDLVSAFPRRFVAAHGSRFGVVAVELHRTQGPRLRARRVCARRCPAAPWCAACAADLAPGPALHPALVSRMFRWCAYCQRLIGEREPLTNYRLTHGICDACEKAVHEYVAGRSTLLARELLAELTQLGARGDLTECDRFVRSALGAGIRPSEILIGLLHPALGEIGEQWERGEVDVRDEHRFTAFASRVLQLVPLPHVSTTVRPSIVLAMMEGNQHDLGIQMLQRLALERGHPCLAVHPGLPDDDIVGMAKDLRPAMLGLSVSMPAAVPAAARLHGRIEDATAGATRVVLGGNAFRRSDPLPLPEGVRVLRSIDDFQLAIDAL